MAVQQESPSSWLVESPEKLSTDNVFIVRKVKQSAQTLRGI